MPLPILGIFSTAISFWKAKQEVTIAATRALADFVVKNWRIILVLAILGLALIKLNALVNERDYWKKLYTDLDHTINVARAERTAELKAARAQGRKDLLNVIAKHQDDMVKIMRKVRSNEAINARTINNYRDGLRLAIERETNLRAGVPENDSDRFAGANSYPAATREHIEGLEEYIKTLEQAGAVCAADYNLCHDYVKNEQSRLGVENPIGN